MCEHREYSIFEDVWFAKIFRAFPRYEGRESFVLPEGASCRVYPKTTRREYSNEMSGDVNLYEEDILTAREWMLLVREIRSETDRFVDEIIGRRFDDRDQRVCDIFARTRLSERCFAAVILLWNRAMTDIDEHIFAMQNNGHNVTSDTPWRIMHNLYVMPKGGEWSYKMSFIEFIQKTQIDMLNAIVGDNTFYYVFMVLMCLTARELELARETTKRLNIRKNESIAIRAKSDNCDEGDNDDENEKEEEEEEKTLINILTFLISNKQVVANNAAMNSLKNTTTLRDIWSRVSFTDFITAILPYCVKWFDPKLLENPEIYSAITVAHSIAIIAADRAAAWCTVTRQILPMSKKQRSFDEIVRRDTSPFLYRLIFENFVRLMHFGCAAVAGTLSMFLPRNVVLRACDEYEQTRKQTIRKLHKYPDNEMSKYIAYNDYAVQWMRYVRQCNRMNNDVTTTYSQHSTILSSYKSMGRIVVRICEKSCLGLLDGSSHSLFATAMLNLLRERGLRPLDKIYCPHSIDIMRAYAKGMMRMYPKYLVQENQDLLEIDATETHNPTASDDFIA